MCFETFESVWTTSRLSKPVLEGGFTWIQCVSKVLNSFEPLVDWVNQEYKVFSHDFGVFESFESVWTTFRMSQPGLWSSFTWSQCVSKLSNLFDPLLDWVNQDCTVVSKISNLFKLLVNWVNQYCNIVSHEFEALRNSRTCLNHFQAKTVS